ncbi:mechanosensitive ion channel domain-containing protein [Coralloluteibacterium thermophilus]|uniref:Mechanosensitive ion channel domain-containing protein n=1 Tax=Coralloluteibacterium thermophilum TaxID=2707049 RepID=A0ABV9NJR8_9GAMM
MQFVLIHVFVRQHEVALDVVGRDLLLVWCAVAAWAVWRLLAPDGVWHARRRRAEPSRARRALRVTLMVGAALLAAQVLLGYTVTVGTMVHAFWMSCLAALAVGLVRGLAERWFLLGERRLALFRYRRRRDAARTAAHGTEENVEPDPDSLPLDRVSAQRRRLLRALTVLLAAIALLWIWGPLLPALDRLDEMRPWDSETSLRAILYGLGILAATAVAARNLPGFLEVALSARTRLDASTRYAVTSIARYVIVIGGVTIGLGLLGMRWNNLQWMAAALTVGLGFGLQEIFANFVSGLILLVERPFRIGDQITIGEFTGTVTRIRTRATTLVDFDNREVVVPNKAFITDRLINWTLSDTRTRVVVRATVARDADPDAVHGVLLAAARAHPLVLAEPAPWSSFAGIGPNGLDFELFVHVRALADRGEVVNALNSRIVRDLEAAGIGLAFAQMDLRVREERPGSATAPPPPPAPGPAAG